MKQSLDISNHCSNLNIIATGYRYLFLECSDFGYEANKLDKIKPIWEYINFANFKNVLTSTLTEHDTKFGKLISAHDTYIDREEAKSILASFIEELNIDESWTFIYIKPDFEIIYYKDWNYFEGVGADSLTIFGKDNTCYFLLTSGTD